MRSHSFSDPLSLPLEKRQNEEIFGQKRDNQLLQLPMTDFNVPFVMRSDRETCDALLKEHHLVVQGVHNRMNHVRILRQLWNTRVADNQREAIQILVKWNNVGTTIDFVRTVTTVHHHRTPSAPAAEQDAWNLDMCVALLPLVCDLLIKHKYEEYV